MRTILYMAISIDGKTTGLNEDVSWVTEDDIKRMDDCMLECGVMVMGSKTYFSFGDDLPNDKALQVVMTKQNELLEKKMNNVIFTSDEPEQVLSMLNQKGFSKVLLAGGHELNASFLEKNLIDEIWLIKKSIILGEGKSLFAKSTYKRLKLIERVELSNNTQELRFTVEK